MTARTEHCARCDTLEDEWTPGCIACRERHRKRALRSGDPDLIGRYHARAHTILEATRQEQARRQRDGESHVDVYRRRRDGEAGAFPFREMLA